MARKPGLGTKYPGLISDDPYGTLALLDQLEREREERKKRQERLNERSTRASQDIVRNFGNFLEERKAIEQDYDRRRERDLTAPRGVSNALTPEMEARRQQAAGVNRAPNAYQTYMMQVMNSQPRQEETRSTDELRREMNRQNRLANATNRMAADMGNQALNNQGLIFDPVYTSNLRTMGQTMEAQQAKAAAATNLYQTVSTQRRAEEEREKYASLMQNPDFAAKSQGDAKQADKGPASSYSEAELLYKNIFHRNDGYKEQDALSVSPAQYLTDEEAATFFYLWNTQGARAAKAYYDGYVENRASARKAEAVQGQAAAYGAYDPWGASIASVGTNLVSGIGMIDIAYQNLVRAIGLEDRNKPINYNSGAMMPALVTDSLREGVTDYLEKLYPNAKIGNSVNVASFLYQTGMSMADSSVAILLNTVGVPEAATLAMMGAAAGTRAIRDARERGASDGQALAFGISSAIMEALFEKISLDRILTESNAHNLAQSILGTLQQGFTEGSEEVMTTLANTVADQIIMGDRSELFTRQRQLMEQGVSEKEALGAAFKQWGTEILGDAIGGFLSGTGMGGVKEFSSARNNPLYRWNMPMAEARALQNIEQNGLPQERGITPELQRSIDAAISAQNEREIAQDRAMLAEDAARRKEAAQRRATPPLPQQAGQITPESVTTTPVQGNAQRGAERAERTGESLISPSGTASPRGSQEAGAESQTLGNPPVPGARVYENGENNSRENRLRIPENPQNVRNSGDNSQGAGLRIVGETENKERMLWTAPKNYTEWAARYGGDKPAADAMRAAGDAALMEAFMDEAASEDTDKPIVEAYLAAWESVKQGTISPMAAVGIVSEAYRSAGADGTRALVDPGSGNLTKEALNAAKDIDRKHRGGLRIGQAANPAAAVGQQAGQNENAPAAEAAEAGNDLADGGRGGLPGQRAGEQDGRVAKLAEARSAVSQFDTASRRRADAKNLPSERVNAREHIPEAAEGSTLTFAPEQMVQQDKELRSVKRRLESITGRKVYYTLGGIRRTSADGKTGTARGAITPDGIYLRCDDDSASVTQLAGHELYHYYEEQFPGLHDRVRQKITERYSEEKFREIAGRYAEKLGRLNGMAEDMDAESYEAMLRRIESEIFADAFGNINYFRLGADRYTDAARETVNETLGRETAAATERRTGPPTQFSMREEVLARNDIDWMDDNSSIKQQLTKHATEINKMTPVAEVEYRNEQGPTLEKLVTNEIPKIGGENISRKGIGFTFDKTGAHRIVHHAANSPELHAAALAAPYVAKYGKLIAGHKNHEGSGTTTITFAAPVVLNGDTVNEGVVIQFDRDGRPRAVNVELQSGGVFRLKKIETPKGSGSLVYRYGKGKAHPTMGVSAETVAETAPEVKSSFSMSEDTDAEYMAAAEAGDTETAQRMVDEAAKQAGYDSPMLYHGTQSFGFTKFDPAKSDDGISLFATSDPKIAQTYSNRDVIRRVNTPQKLDTPEQIIAALKETPLLWDAQYFPADAVDKKADFTDMILDRLFRQLNERAYFDAADENASAIWKAASLFKRSIGTEDVKQAVIDLYDAIVDAELYLRADIVSDTSRELTSAVNMLLGNWDAYWYAGNAHNTETAIKTLKKLGTDSGNYALYGRTEGMLELDGAGENWNRVPISGEISKALSGERTATTREIARYGKDNGYTGVLIRNITDNGGIGIGTGAGDVYIYYDGISLKSADPVTYDDNGNIIPLSERFNPENNDIRWSMSEDEDIPESAAEYSRQRYREEHREPQSAAEYARMKQRALEREAEIRKLEKKGEASAEDRREAAWARREFEAPKEKANKQQATIAKKDLRNTIINEFGIPEGRKAEIGKLIDAYADQAYKDGKLTETDRQALFDKLYSEGVMTVPANDAFRAAREIIKGGRVYVPESVKHEFGDDWGSFRREAFAEGILLTNNENDRGWDSWNQELSGELPGLFAEDETDPREFLERVVHLAREGRDQEMSLAEYAATVIGTEYVSEDDLLDNMERKLDWALRSYADKAGLEIWMKNKTEEKLARQREKFGERLDREKAQRLAREQKEREKRKEAARKQTMNRELREMQQKTLKQLQWLSRNRQKFSGNMQDRLNEILSDIDIYAISAADEAHLDKASNKTWRELADIYKDARENDPNFLPSKDLERIVARLDNRKIGDMDIDAVTDLYKAAVGLRTELYNRNNVIGSELHETFQEVYDQVKDEMSSAKGGYQTGAKGTAQKFFSDLQLTPMNLLERMAGWNKDSTWYKMAKQLEQGERAQRKFKTDSARMLAPFLEEHKEWVKKADGQGKDAIWYEVEVPELLELGMGDKPIFGNTVKVWMTPAQKVHMYLESQNYDNLRHMTGGRTFADKELYSKGKRAEAFAQGKTIRLAPESVKNLVKDLTPEEKALADALRPFYNEFSKKEINRVSNLLLGYNKAMEGDYAPIYTNQNYTKSEPGIFDTTAEGVGNLKSRVVSANPTLNISALDAFEKSVDRTSRYVGLAVPVRNMNTLMNWREKGNSMADVLTHKWGEDGKRFVNDLLTEIQSGRETEQSSIEKLTNAALSRYISAVFGANPSIVTKQFASYPLAAAYLGWENMPLNVPRAAKVDTDLIAKYTGEYDYRQLGYAMPETATLKDNPGKLQERGPLNFIFGGGAITWMDGFTVRTLWTWAENKVNKEQPGLEKGSQADIDAGNSEYYKAVAAEFEEALSRSQPMYDTMHRANIMRESNPITRAFTLFKTVPMQEYNMLRQAIGEAQYAKEAKLDKETQAAARQKAGRAFAGILTGNLMIGAITILNALWKNRGKKYRDEDGELSAEKLIAEAGKQYFKDAAGLVIGGGEVADILSAVLFGDKWYGLETPGMEQIGSILEQTVKAGQTVQGLVRDSIEVLANGGNWAQYMADHSDKYISAVDSVARTMGTYATGLPIDNVKAYLLGAVQWLSPEVKTAYEDVLKKADRSGLKGLSGASLEIRTKHILQERAGSAEDSTVETLAGLYEAGYKDAIPAAQQTKVSIDGEERQMNLAQQQTYQRTWQETVGGSIDELVSSKEFQNADEATQAKMLKKLYDLASDRAKMALFDDTEENTWDKAEEMLDAGISLEDYVSAYARFNAIKNTENLSSYDKGKQQREMINGMDAGDDAKLALYQSLNPTATARIEQFKAIMGAGVSFDTLMTVFDKYSAINEKGDLTASGKAKEFALWVDNQKYSEKQKQTIKDQLLYWQQMSAQTERYDKIKAQGFDPNTAAAIDKALSELTPLPGKDGVSNAQKWNAALKVLGTKASKKDKLSAVSMFFDTAMTTESGKPSQWSKINRVVDSGKSVEDTMKMVEDEKLDVYVKWMDSDAKAAGVKSDTYISFREKYNNTKSVKDANGKDVKGQTKKDQMMAYIDGLNLTADQKDTLFLEEYAESGLKDTPWHKGGGKGSGSYAMARTPALRIPEAPRAEKIQSGLKVSTGEPAQRLSSGLRIRGTQPGEARQGSGLRIRGTATEPARQTSGLRIRDSAPAAQAPRSGLRIRAK